MSDVENSFFGEPGPATVRDEDVFGRPGALEHEHFSGRRFVQVAVLVVWGSGLVLAATLTWNGTRFAAPGVSRWILLVAGLVILAVSVPLAGSLRERYEPAPDEDPVFTELQAGFQERYLAGPADFAWAVVSLAPLVVLFAM